MLWCFIRREFVIRSAISPNINNYLISIVCVYNLVYVDWLGDLKDVREIDFSV